MTETNQQTRVAPTHPHVDRTVAPGMWNSHPLSSTSKVFFTSSTLLTLPRVPFFLCPLTASWKCGKAPRHSAVVHYWRKVTSGARPRELSERFTFTAPPAQAHLALRLPQSRARRRSPISVCCGWEWDCLELRSSWLAASLGDSQHVGTTPGSRAFRLSKLKPQSLSWDAGCLECWGNRNSNFPLDF